MQTETYRSVPFSVGGVAHPKPGPITLDSSAPAMQFGAEDDNGFRPMFFSREIPRNDAEAQLRLDWEQAAARAVANAYASAFGPKKGRLVDISA